MTRRHVNMRIPQALLERVDRSAGDRQRTEFTVRALERALGSERPRSLADLMRESHEGESTASSGFGVSGGSDR